MDTIRIRIKHPSTTPSRELCSPSRSVLYPEGEVGSSDCFISSVEHVIPWASTTRAGPPRPGTEFAVCWCSELARVGVDLARDGQMDRFLVCGSAGPPRVVSKASPCRKSGPNSEVGSTRVGSVRGHVSLVLGTPVLQELGAVFPNFRGLMRYGILQHDPQVRRPEIFRLAPINAFERRRLAAGAFLEKQRFLTKSPICSAACAFRPPTMVRMRS